MPLSMDPYAVLELQRDCSEEEISRAYKKQCLRWHPDKNRDNEEEAKRRFILARQAFELLFDKSARAEYDRKREGERVRDEKQRERMEKADGERKRHMEDLLRREKEAEGGSKKTEGGPKTASQVKKNESASKESFEELARRLEREVNEEMRRQREEFLAQQEKEAAAAVETENTKEVTEKEEEAEKEKEASTPSGLDGKSLEELQQMFFEYDNEPAAKKVKATSEEDATI